MSQVILDRISVLVTAAAQNGLRQDGFAPTRYLQIVKAPVTFTIKLGEPNGESIDVPAGTTGSIQICDPNTELVEKFFLDIPAGSGEIVILSSPNMQVSFESGSLAGGLSPRRLWHLTLGQHTPREAGVGGLLAGQNPARQNAAGSITGNVSNNGTSDVFTATDWDDALGFHSWLLEVAAGAGDWRFLHSRLEHLGMSIGDIVSSAGSSGSVDINGNYFVMGTTAFARLTRVSAPGTEIDAFWGLGLYQRSTLGLEAGCVGFHWNPDESGFWQAMVLDYNGGTETVRLAQPLTGVTAELTLQDLRLAWGYKAGGLPFVAWIVNGLVAHEISGHGLAVEPFPGFSFQPFCGVGRQSLSDKVELMFGMRGGWWCDHYSPNVVF